MKKRMLAWLLCVALCAALAPAQAAEREEVPALDDQPALTAELPDQAVGLPARETEEEASPASGEEGGDIPALPLAGGDAAVVDSGSCGSAVTWAFSQDGQLRVSGSGAMKTYSSALATPWYSHREQITSVVIDPGVTSIGNFSFASCTALTQVTIPEGITLVGKSAFDGCESLETVYAADLAAWCRMSFVNGNANPLRYADRLVVDGQAVTTLTIPEGVTAIGACAFYGWTGLEMLVLSDSLTEVKQDAFTGCEALTDVFCPKDDRADLTISPVNNGNRPLTAGTTHWHYGYTGQPLVTFAVESDGHGTLALPRCAYLGETFTFSSIPQAGYQLAQVEADRGVLEGHTYAVPEESGFDVVTFTASFEPIFPGREVAASGSCGNDALWVLYADGLLYIYGAGLMEDYTSAAKNPWYDHRELITAVQVADGVTGIGRYAFSDCPYLTSAVIAKTVDTINDSAFSRCPNLGRAEFLGDAPGIGKDVFYKLNNNKLVLPMAGQFCISYHAGDGWTGNILQEEGAPSTWKDYFIDWADAEPITDFSTLDKNNRNSQGIFFTLKPDSLTARVGDNGTGFNNSGYYGAGDGKVVIPATVTDSDGVEYQVDSLGQYAFADNKTVTHIQLGENVRSFVVDSFQDTSNLALVAPHSLNTFFKAEDDILYDSQLAYLYVYPAKKEGATFAVPETVDTITSNAFRGNPFLREVVVPANVKTIGPTAFHGCRCLEKLTLPFLGANAEDTKPFVHVFGTVNDLPKTLKEVVITGEELCPKAFENCANLQRITLPSCSTVPDSSFNGCKSLISLRFANNDLPYADGQLLLPDGVSKVGAAAFQNCAGLTAATIGVGAASIGNSAFSGCTALTGVVIPDTVESIGSSAFQNCGSLTAADLPDGVKTIGASAFARCGALPALVIPDSVATVGTSAWSECAGLKTVTIGRGLTSLGKQAFYKCPGIQSFTVDPANSNYASDKWGVLFTTGLSTLINYPASRVWPYYNVPRATTTIEDYAFQGHTGLTNLFIPTQVTTLKKDAIEADTSTMYFLYRDTPAAKYVVVDKGYTHRYMNDLVLQEIEVRGLPRCAVVPLGATELEGLYLVGTYSGQILQLDEYDVDFGKEEPGLQTATVSSGGYKATFEVLRYDPARQTPLDFGLLDKGLPDDALRLTAVYAEDGRALSIQAPVSVNGELLALTGKAQAQAMDKALLFQLDAKTLIPLNGMEPVAGSAVESAAEKPQPTT